MGQRNFYIDTSQYQYTTCKDVKKVPLVRTFDSKLYPPWGHIVVFVLIVWKPESACLPFQQLLKALPWIYKILMSTLKNSSTCCSPRCWSVEKYSTRSGPTCYGQTTTLCPHVHCHLSGKLCVRDSIYSLSKVVLLPQSTQDISNIRYTQNRIASE